MRAPPRTDNSADSAFASPETGIITDEKLTRAAGQENGDPAVAAEFAAAGPAGQQGGGSGGDGALTWYGDPACGTGELRAVIAAARR